MFNEATPNGQVVTTSDWKLDSVEQQASQDFTMHWQYAYVAATQVDDWNLEEPSENENAKPGEVPVDESIWIPGWIFLIVFTIITIALIVMAFMINIFLGFVVALFTIIGYFMWVDMRLSSKAYALIYLMLLIGIPILFIIPTQLF